MEDEVELYLPEDDCAAGGTCPGDGVFLPQDLHNRDLDQRFAGSEADTGADLGIADVDSYPLTDELFPTVFDEAHITLDGVMDCFARHYPERASLLCALIEQEGYEVAWHGNPEREIAGIRDRLNTMQRADWGIHAPMWSAAQREERARLDNRIETLQHWGFAGRTLHIHSRINRNIDATTVFTDDPSLINWSPTNRQGADWLNAVMGDWMVRSGIPGATSDEEFADNRLSRRIWGSLSIVFGVAEIIGGVALMGGTLGLGTLAGGALTIAGFEAITQGIDMWSTPREAEHGTGWLGDGTRAMLTEFGVISDDDQATFNAFWSFAMLGLSLGGSGIMGFAGNSLRAARAGRAATGLDFVASLPRRGLATARMAIVAVRNSRFGRLVVNFAPLPSGRIVLNIKNVGRAVAPVWESLPRLRLRLLTARRARVAERARRLAAGEAGLVSIRGGVSTIADARKLVEEVAAFMGIGRHRLDDLISGIRLGRPGQSSSFNSQGILRLRHDIGRIRYLPYRSADYNEFAAMAEVFHELQHALDYQKWIRAGRRAEDYWASARTQSPAYWADEMRVEQSAMEWAERVGRPRVLRERHYGNAEEAARLLNLLEETLAEGRVYIERSRELAGL